MRNFRVHFVLFLVKIMMIVTLTSMNNLMFRRSFFRTKSKANSQNSIWIIWVSSPEISITFLCRIRRQGHVCSLLSAQFFIWWVVSFFADSVICSFHQFVNSEVQIDMILINATSFAVKHFVIWFIIIFCTFNRGQMCFGALIKIKFCGVVLA